MLVLSELWLKQIILIRCGRQVSLVSGSSNTANIITFLKPP